MVVVVVVRVWHLHSLSFTGKIMVPVKVDIGFVKNRGFSFGFGYRNFKNHSDG